VSDVVGLVWTEHLTGADRQLLAEVAGVVTGAAPSAERLRAHPDLLARLLSHPHTERRVFGPGDADEPFLRASPFLTFAVAVHRAAAELDQLTFTSEWVGPRRRIPVFDVAALRDFLSDPLRTVFLVELLASYTHVASGSTWVRTGRGWRRRRFSELDPVRMASLLEVVGETERAGVYRRLGDLALFLTGVFPDHTATRWTREVDSARLLRSVGSAGGGAGAGAGAGAGVGGRDLPEAVAQMGAVALLEHLGRRWYELAADVAAPPLTSTMQVTADVAQRFGHARRVLNYVTDRFLFPFRSGWFGVAAG
jgi:hypothetical protein